MSQLQIERIELRNYNFFSNSLLFGRVLTCCYGMLFSIFTKDYGV